MVGSLIFKDLDFLVKAHLRLWLWWPTVVVVVGSYPRARTWTWIMRLKQR